MKGEEKVEYCTCEMIREFESSIAVDILLKNDFLLILKHEINQSILYVEYALIMIISFGNPVLFAELLRKQISAEYFMFSGMAIIIITMLILAFVFFKLINNYLIESKYNRLLKDFDINKIDPNDVAIHFDNIVNIEKMNGVISIKTKYKFYKLVKVNEDFFKILSKKI